MNDPLISKEGSINNVKRGDRGFLSGSLLQSFIIPAPSSKKKKLLMFSTCLAFFIFAITLSAVLVLLFARHARFGGMKLSTYLFTIDGVVAGYVFIMGVVTAIMRIASMFSKRFRYYATPFAFPSYTTLWAVLCFAVLPVIVPDIENDNHAARILQDCIGIVASCSIVSAIGSILLIVIERVVYGDLQEKLWNVLWSERCVAAVALENHAPTLRAMTESSQPANVLSLAQMVREGNHGLPVWLGLEEVDYKDDNAQARCAANITNMIMRRDVNNKGCVAVEDLSSIPSLSHKDAHRLFRVFDFSTQGYASPADIKHAITNILTEKKTIVDLCTARSLIVDIVHQIIRAIVITICIVIVLVVLMSINVYTLLVGLGTAFIGLGFALSTTIQGLLESLQMIFFIRPFEIGDIVRINDGPPLQVEKVTIISTLFYSLDGYGVYYPNAELARSRIANWRRSKDVILDIPLYLAMITRADHIAKLKHRVQSYMDANAQQYAPKFMLLVSDTRENFITVTIRVTLKTIWQERMIWTRYASDLRIFATSQIVEMGVYYQPTGIYKNIQWEPQMI